MKFQNGTSESLFFSVFLNVILDFTDKPLNQILNLVCEDIYNASPKYMVKICMS